MEEYGLMQCVRPALLLRKPLEKGLSIAQNVQKHGTGALNIDACRFGYGDPCWVGDIGTIRDPRRSDGSVHRTGLVRFGTLEEYKHNYAHPQGRWPANLYQCSDDDTNLLNRIDNTHEESNMTKDLWADMPNARVLHGDCMELLRSLPDNSIDAIVTDPPYGMSGDGIMRTWADLEEGHNVKGFMGKSWDSAVPCHNFFAECLRVIKHGGHMIAFSSTRTVCALGMAAQQGGWRVRDMLHWCYFSGFPKSHNVSTAIDKRGGAQIGWFGKWLKDWRLENSITQKEIAKLFPSNTGNLTGCVANWELGYNMPTNDQFNTICKAFNLPFDSLVEAEREIIGKYNCDMGGLGGQRLGSIGGDITKPATQEAQRWDGFGTALKPAVEPALLLRKPLEQGLTIAQNVLKHGTGALNIDGCRFGYGDPCWVGPQGTDLNGGGYNAKGTSKKSKGDATSYYTKVMQKEFVNPQGRWPANLYQCPKASRSEREEGLDHLEGKMSHEITNRKEGSAGAQHARSGKTITGEVRNIHPTVKPIKLMRWCCCLIGGQKGSTILDPFAGSGTTLIAGILEGFNVIGMEMTDDHSPIIEGRVQWAKEQYKRENAQLSLFGDL